MKYRLLAFFMACFYLFPSVSVLASEVNTSSESEINTEDSTAENSSAENDTTTSSEHSTEENTAAEDATTSTPDTSSQNITFSAIQTPSDGGCIIESDNSSGLNLTADGVVLMDAASGAILYSRNADTKHYPASITKIMTTLVALENAGLSESITCNKDTLYAIEQDSSRVGLEPGEIISLEDALYFVMLQSGNDAAAVVAEHVGGTVEGFVELMNKKVEEIGCTGTHFANPHGLHSDDHYTTARDMALIMQAAVQNPDFCKIASATNFSVDATNLNDQRGVWNHHKMILPASEYHYEGVREGKTGFTTKARNTLVTTAEKNGIKLIAVLLQGQSAANNYYETADLFDYGFNNFTILKPLDNFNLKEAAETAGLSEENMEKLTRYNAIYNTNYSIFAPSSVTLNDIHVTFSSEGPSNGVFGQLHVFYKEKEIGTLNVYYDVEAEYKIIANEDTEVTVTAASNIPFILVGVMAVLVILIIILGASIIIRP